MIEIPVTIARAPNRSNAVRRGCPEGGPPPVVGSCGTAVGVAVGAAVAVGYHGTPDQLIERYRQAEVAKRERKPLSELAFSGGWNTPLKL